MKYNYNNYSKEDNIFIKDKLNQFKQVLTLGSHINPKFWRQLIFIAFYPKNNESVYLFFDSKIDKKEKICFKISQSINISLLENFIKIYNHKAELFNLDSHRIVTKLEQF